MANAKNKDIGVGVFKMWCAWVEAMPEHVREWYAKTGGQPKNPGRVTRECSVLCWAAQDYAIFGSLEAPACEFIRGVRDSLMTRAGVGAPEEFEELRIGINAGLERYGPLFTLLPEKEGYGLMKIGEAFAQATDDEGFWTTQLGIAEFHATYMATQQFIRGSRAVIEHSE
ncbi:MAG: hypothetical protein HYR73_05070 [Candidatus Eisenbacteria bacterium]|nr:hypothetical protein [Candidatus Eisenbacteria bacterium]